MIKSFKIFENKSLKISMMTVYDMFEGYAFTTLSKPFFTKEDAINWLINKCNKEQEKILEKEPHKKSIENIQIHNLQDCENFLWVCAELLGHDELEPSVHIFETTIESVELDPEVKRKIEAHKYNI